jgi:hypothetical protein
MATFNDFEQRKKNEMAREQRGSCVCVYIYIYIYYLQWNNKKRKKKRKKQKTDYNKILVGARTRDRIQTKEEMIRNSRLNGSNSIFVFKSYLQVYNSTSPMSYASRLTLMLTREKKRKMKKTNLYNKKRKEY